MDKNRNFKSVVNKEENGYPTNLIDNQWQGIKKFLDMQVRRRLLKNFEKNNRLLLESRRSVTTSFIMIGNFKIVLRRLERK